MEEAVLRRSLGQMQSYVDQVDVMQATAFQVEQELMIKDHIQSLPGGAKDVNVRVRGLLEQWQIPFIDDLYRKLYAQPEPETIKIEQPDNGQQAQQQEEAQLQQ